LIETGIIWIGLLTWWWHCRILFTITTALVAMDVMRNRNSSSIKPANNMEAQHGGV